MGQLENKECRQPAWFPPFRVVLSGCPGSGKTTLIEGLRQRGFTTIPEVWTHFYERAQAEGNTHQFRIQCQKPEFFLKMMDQQWLWECSAAGSNGESRGANESNERCHDGIQGVQGGGRSGTGRGGRLLFLDRSMHDLVAFAQYYHIPVPTALAKQETQTTYEFVLFPQPPPESQFSKSDFCSYSETLVLHIHLFAYYTACGYTIHVIPWLPNEERVDFVIELMNRLLS